MTLAPAFFRISLRRAVLPFFGLALTMTTAQPTVQIGLFTAQESGMVEVRLKPDGDFDQLLSNMVFTISWPTSANVQLDNAQMVSLCDRLPVVPNGDGVQQSGSRSYQTYFMLSLQQLAGGCPLVNGQELTVMRIPVTGVTSCVTLKLTNDTYTAANNKNFYLSLNGVDRTGSIYHPTAKVCDCSTIALDINTDGQPAQTGWEFYNGTGQLLLSGNLNPGQTNTTVHLSACRSDACYRIRITDAGGNGISGGGYTVSVNGDRVIDATGLFGASSSLADEGGFCSPLGPTFLLPGSADLTGITAGTTLQAQTVSGADKYGFWIFDTHGSFDTVITRSTPSLKLYNALWNAMPHDLRLNVRVQARTGGSFGAYGKACNATLGAPGMMMAMQVDEGLPTDFGDLTVYPNPIQDGSFNVRFEANGTRQAHMELFNATGQSVLSQEASFTDLLNQRLQLPEGSPAGVYMLAFTTADGRMMRLLVKQ